MTNPSLDDVKAALRDFVQERDWDKYHDPKNLAMLLASEAGELVAAYRWVDNAEADAWSKEPERLQRIQHELADVGIALVMLCERLGVDLPEAMMAKIELNRRNYPVAKARENPDRV